jgi:single-strand DNA-binding protein
MNHCIFSGHLGRDAEVKTLDGGRKVANFSIAVSKEWKDKSGQKQERTDWMNFSCWDKQADLAELYFKKGTGLIVTGECRNEKYDKDGETRTATKFEMRSFEFLPKGKGSTDQSPAPSAVGNTAPADVPIEPESDLPF